MDEHSLAELIKNKGYLLLSKAHPKSPGYTGLVIGLREHPSEKRFDPVALHLHLVDDESGVCHRTTLRHSNSCKVVRHVCPGQVTLVDQADSAIDFFTFGGSLECTSLHTDFVYELKSPAPILDLRGSIESFPDQLAAETEALIAEVKVKWQSDEEGFLLRLGQVDPFKLYVSSIESILAHYHHTKSLMDVFREFSDFLHWERRWLQTNGLWPRDVTTIESLIGAP